MHIAEAGIVCQNQGGAAAPRQMAVKSRQISSNMSNPEGRAGPPSNPSNAVKTAPYPGPLGQIPPKSRPSNQLPLRGTHLRRRLRSASRSDRGRGRGVHQRARRFSRCRVVERPVVGTYRTPPCAPKPQLDPPDKAPSQFELPTPRNRDRRAVTSGLDRTGFGLGLVRVREEKRMWPCM